MHRKGMHRNRKVMLVIVLAIIIAIHVALFAAGGHWRSMGKVLVGVDIFSGWFIVGAIREVRKLERQKED